MERSYYKLLGVQENCSQDEVKKAFRKLSLQHHPDKPGGNEEKFKEIVQAYNILSDKVTRRQYDLGFDIATNYNFEDDILEKFHRLFNDIPHHDNSPYFTEHKIPVITKERSKDTIEILDLDLVEVCNGTVRTVRINKKVNCPSCKGRSITGVCTNCKGKRIIEVEKKLVIDIKPGVLEGQEIFRFNEGNEELNKSPGDRIFVIKYMRNSGRFHYQPFRDIVYKATIHLSDAVWLIQIPVRAPNVRSDLLLTKNTQGRIVKTGDKMTVMNEGLPDYFNPKTRGRLIVEFNVLWPKHLSQEQHQEINNLFKTSTVSETEQTQGSLGLLYLEKLEEDEEIIMRNSHFPEKFLKFKEEGILQSDDRNATQPPEKSSRRQEMTRDDPAGIDGLCAQTTETTLATSSHCKSVSNDNSGVINSNSTQDANQGSLNGTFVNNDSLGFQDKGWEVIDFATDTGTGRSEDI